MNKSLEGVIFIELIFFMLGALFSHFILPILDEGLSLILTRMEIVKGKMSVTLTKINGKIQNAAYPDETSSVDPIGFKYEPPTEEEYEEE